MRFREKLAKWMWGRNGPDQLCQAIMWCSLTLTVANLFFNSVVLSLLAAGLLWYAVFRMLSRKVWKRQKENRAFLQLFARARKRIRLKKNQWRDRKTHVYHSCPKCKNILRLPRIKGDHRVCCPCCGERFRMNV